jgi:hypothetical protein
VYIAQFGHGDIVQDEDRGDAALSLQFDYRTNETEGRTRILKYPMTVTFATVFRSLPIRKFF